MAPVELTATRTPKPWRFRLAAFLIRMAARVIGVPLVIRVQDERMVQPVVRVSEYLEMKGEFEGYPRKWQRRSRLHRILGKTEDKP